MTDLDLDAIEARMAPDVRTSSSLLDDNEALVAEVRRLRETVEALAQSTSDPGRDLLIEGERADAARAEAERLREAWAVRDAADEGMRYTIGEIEADLSNARREINRLRAELDRFKPQPMSQQCRDGRHGQTGDWRCHNCRCLCHTFEHSRAGHDPACESLQREYDRTMGDLAVAVAEAARLREALQARFDFEAHLARQREFSDRTFGPGLRTEGVCDHIRKELSEIEDAPTDLGEWIDVVILGLDGAGRTGAAPQQIIAALVAKQQRNEQREWPDWRSAPADKAIEHVRALDAALDGETNE